MAAFVRVQDKGEAKAAAMPESKRWIDPAIIQRNFEANEAARAAEEERRRAAVVEGNQRMLSALNRQVAQRAVCEASKRESDEKFSKAYLATAGAEQERALAERRRRLQLKLQVRHAASVQALPVHSRHALQRAAGACAGQAGARGADARECKTAAAGAHVRH